MKRQRHKRRAALTGCLYTVTRAHELTARVPSHRRRNPVRRHSHSEKMLRLACLASLAALNNAFDWSPARYEWAVYDVTPRDYHYEVRTAASHPCARATTVVCAHTLMQPKMMALP